MKKITVPEIRARKGAGPKIAMVTAYDYTMARILDGCGADVFLVGDTLGVIMAGYPNTLPVTMEETLYHTRAVVRGTRNALVVADLPFLSYQVSLEEARRNAGRALKEGGAEAVKLEGGLHMMETIRALVDIDIPVMGHVGLTPQSIHRMGGYRVQGRERAEWKRLLQDARAVEAAGAFAVVLEGVPLELARQITGALKIPTIGIGAGPHCDGQVLVAQDLLGMFDEMKPTFVKQYADIKTEIQGAVRRYVEEVRSGKFPGLEHSYTRKKAPPRKP